MAISTSTKSWWVTTKRPLPSNVPTAVASTSSAAQQANKAAKCWGGTAITMRSCASESQISHGCKPAYFKGTCDNSTRAPVCSPISPIADDNPPAPQSVMALYRPASRAWMTTSISFFSVMGSPICTALPASWAVVWVSSIDEKVAPWMPSRPVRPPSTTIASPTPILRGCLPWGANPTVPQKTNGLAI